MAEETKDIESIKKQLKPEFKTVLVNNIKHFIILWLIIFGFILFINSLLGSGNCEHSPAHALHKELQSAAAIYVAEERLSPNVFSDFVILKGEVFAPKTLSLKNVSGIAKNLNTNDLKVIFEDGDVVIYHLENEMDVSLSFKENEKEKQYFYSFIIFTLIFTFIITIAFFIIVRILLKNYVLEIVVCLILLIILAIFIVPKISALY